MNAKQLLRLSYKLAAINNAGRSADLGAYSSRYSSELSTAEKQLKRLRAALSVANAQSLGTAAHGGAIAYSAAYEMNCAASRLNSVCREIKQLNENRLHRQTTADTFAGLPLHERPRPAFTDPLILFNELRCMQRQYGELQTSGLQGEFRLHQEYEEDDSFDIDDIDPENRHQYGERRWFVAVDRPPVSIRIVDDLYEYGRFRYKFTAYCGGRFQFSAEAIDPNPALSDQGIVHPHVNHGHVCLGEAERFVMDCLIEGRLHDVCNAVDAVLETYNAQSPYVPIDAWHKLKCGSCGYWREPDTMESRGGYMHVCESCRCDCPRCKTGAVKSRMVRCPDCGDRVCRGCCRMIYSRDLLVCESCVLQREAYEAEPFVERSPAVVAATAAVVEADAAVANTDSWAELRRRTLSAARIDPDDEREWDDDDDYEPDYDDDEPDYDDDEPDYDDDEPDYDDE